MQIRTDVIHTTCPFCDNSFNVSHNFIVLNIDKFYGTSYVRQISCLNCMRRFIIFENNKNIEYQEIAELPDDMLTFYGITKEQVTEYFAKKPDEKSFLVEKKQFLRPFFSIKKLPNALEDEVIIKDYKEASSILNVSPRASSALSRKCIAYILKKNAPISIVTEKLSEIIQETIDSHSLPMELSNLLSYVLEVNDFESNPVKDQLTNTILEIPKEEAELNLDVAYRLIDFYYIQPAQNIAIKQKVETSRARTNRPRLF